LEGPAAGSEEEEEEALSLVELQVLAAREEVAPVGKAQHKLHLVQPTPEEEEEEEDVLTT